MDDAPSGYEVQEDGVPDIPWWAWLWSAVFMAACYGANGGRGFVAFLAGAGLCRFILAPRLTRGQTAATAVSMVLAVAGFIIFGVTWMTVDHVLGLGGFQ
jgi:hypothetical protein